MLKRENRLKKRKEFAYIYKKGSRAYSANFSLIYVKSRYETARFGISVSNRVGKAVIRNKIKRRMRVVLRDVIANIKFYNAVIVAKPSVVELDFSTLKQEILKLIKKANLINENI